MHTMTDNQTFRHDLKNQLGIIQGFVDLLIQDTASGDPRGEDLQEIRQAATAALELVERAFPPSADAVSGEG